MDITNQRFSMGLDRLNFLSEGFKSTISSWKHCFFEFDNLFTNSSFGLNVRKYVFDYVERISRIYSEMNLISRIGIFRGFVSKRDTSTESFHNPNRDNRADRSHSNSNFIRREISIFFNKFRNSYGTFCIYISSKIREIYFRTRLSFTKGSYMINMIQICDERIFSAIFKFFQQRISKISKITSKIIDKNFAFRMFFFSKRKNILSNFKCEFSSCGPDILNRPINIFWNGLSNMSSKILLKGNKNIFFRRTNRYGSFSKRISSCIRSFPYGKMAITIDVASQVGVIYIHVMNYRPSVDSKSTSNSNETPSGDQLSVTDFKAAISWYGSFVTITDQVQFVVQDRVLNEATKVLSLQLGLTIDTLIRDMMVSTASSIACTSGSNGTVPTEINDTDIQTAIIALRQGNARLMTNPLPGENKFGTAPVRASYWGFMSVDLQADLENVSSFISVANYPNPMNALEAEWGSTRNVRWLLNTNGFSGGTSVGGTTGPIYSSFILGQEAKMLGLYKSSLIDLETLQGDKGQAEAEMLLAA